VGHASQQLSLVGAAGRSEKRCSALGEDVAATSVVLDVLVRLVATGLGDIGILVPVEAACEEDRGKRVDGEESVPMSSSGRFKGP